MMLLPRAIAVAIYLVVDIVYVIMSKGYYEKAMRLTFPEFTADRKLSAVLSYVTLALGWFVLVAPLIEKATSYLYVYGVATVYALAVYGVYNFTLYTILQNYPIEVLLRDLMWGMSAIGWLSILYYLYVQKHK